VDTLLVALRVILSLGAVLGLLWYVQRRMTRGPRAQRTASLVTVVGRQGIGQKASVVVVDVEGTRFVLGVTEQSVNVLHRDAGNVAGNVPKPDAKTDVGTGVDFARTLTDATATESLTPPLEFRPRRDRHLNGKTARVVKSGKLGGSILSPATWQQTAAVLRQGR
jgi:flagellar protein FliO/FliZ